MQIKSVVGVNTMVRRNGGFRRGRRGTMVRKRVPGAGRMSTKDLARSAWITSKRALNKAEGELKHAISTVALTTIWDGSAGTPNLYQLDNIAQGVGQSNRVGLTIQHVGVTVRMQLQQGQSIRAHTIRVILFKYKQEHGNVIVASELLRQNTPYHLQPKAYSQRMNSKILYDKFHVLNQFGSDDSTVGTERVNKNHKTFTFHANLKGTGQTVYVGSDATGITKERGGLYLFLVADDPNLTTSAPHVEFVAQLTYRDA